LRFGALQGEPERQIVEAVQDPAGLDMLVLRDIDFLDDAETSVDADVSASTWRRQSTSPGRR
jgi:hypothetical protein